MHVYEPWNLADLGLNFCSVTYYLHGEEEITFFFSQTQFPHL